MTATVQVTMEITIEVGSKRNLPISQVLDEIRLSAERVVSDHHSLSAAMLNGHAKIVGDPGTAKVVMVDDIWLKI